MSYNNDHHSTFCSCRFRRYCGSIALTDMDAVSNQLYVIYIILLLAHEVGTHHIKDSVMEITWHYRSFSLKVSVAVPYICNVNAGSTVSVFDGVAKIYVHIAHNKARERSLMRLCLQHSRFLMYKLVSTAVSGYKTEICYVW